MMARIRILPVLIRSERYCIKVDKTNIRIERDLSVGNFS